MMNAPTMSPSLDEIFDDFALADPKPDDVSEWVDRYPRFANDIRAFAESWFAIADLPEDESEAFEGENALLQDRERFLERGLAMMRQRLDEIQPASAPQSLSELLDRRSVTAPKLRETLGLSRRFWSSLTGYPIIRDTPEAATIWDRIVSAFARALDAPQEWVASALDTGAARSLSFSKSNRRPVSREPIDVEELVRSDTGLAPQTRTYFLTGEGPVPGISEADEQLD